MSSLPNGLDFNEATASGVVAGRLKDSDDPRLAEAMTVVVKHLHGIIGELRPTRQDLHAAISFLTDVGHACDDNRQEWVLLFDLLGVSTLVEDINSSRPRAATRNTVRGPFYRPDAPSLPNGTSISLDGKGETLTVCGQVVDLDGDPVANAKVETWQANAEGLFENQQPDLQPENNLRGAFMTDANGAFRFGSVKPGGYDVPDDGPVGRLLTGLGYPLHRPAHLHFQISAPGFQTVTTQVFDTDDPDIGDDAVLGVRRDLLGEFRAVAGKGGTREWVLEFTFVLARARPLRSS